MKTVRKTRGWIIVATLLAWACTAYAAHKPKDADCLACHSDPSLTREVDGKKISLYVDADKLQQSVHGSMFSCVDCHKDVTGSPHKTPPVEITCAQCHAASQGAYLHSDHAKGKKPDGTPAATCEDCHGGAHEILAASDAKSPINHSNIPATCGRCHGQKFVMEASGLTAQIFFSYQDSVHGRAIKGGSQSAAVCTDCHGAHNILPASNVNSPINKFNVPATCGKCHGQITQVFMQSVHGQALARGSGLAPSCTDCHGIHTIKAPTDPNSSVSEQNLARYTCARCHQGVLLTREFGEEGDRVSTYLDSYHGLALRGGSVVVADCASCHGVHNILPSSDPRSKINRANLEATCGQCHKGVTQRFILGKVHIDPNQPSSIGGTVVRWVRRFYLVLILLVIGAMFLHNAIIWRSKAVARRRTQRHTLLRMTPNQRWQHLFLLISFTILALTGFALKFPNSWLAEVLRMGETLRSTVHRIAGVVLIGTGIYHLFYIALTRDGRRLVRDLMPVPKDAFDAWATMRYYLGLDRERPKFGRFSYAEKTEYWALVWGTVLMSITGIMLWARITVGSLLARWWLDVATAVHFYEAILAVLAIIVWHLYQVIFDPDVYPMNWAWWNGKMPVEHYRLEHELDTETLAQTEAKNATPGAEGPGGDTAAKSERGSPPQ